MRKTSFIAILALIVLSCSKADIDLSASRKAMISDKKWLFVDFELKNQSGMVVADFDMVPDYSKDDYYVFYGDGNLECNQAILKDPMVSLQIIEWGTWKFINNGRTMKVNTNSSGADGYELSIVKLTGDELVFSIRDVGTGFVRTSSFRVLP